MTRSTNDGAQMLELAPYFDQLLERLALGDETCQAAFGRHVHWGYWPTPEEADGTAADYGAAAERLCRVVCDAAGIEDGMRVLDVGCGIGGTIASLNERFSNLRLVGVNIDERQLVRAAEVVQPQRGNQIEFIHGDACRLDFPAGSFDAILAVECIFHFDSRAKFFAGAAHALRPGGRIALSDFMPPADALAALRDLPVDRPTAQTFGQINVCSLDDYRQLADDSALEPPELQDITAGTMPTYPFLRQDCRRQEDRVAARTHARAVSRLETACQRGWLNYVVLSFTRCDDCD